jgi:phosphate transport system permease protein
MDCDDMATNGTDEQRLGADMVKLLSETVETVESTQRERRSGSADRWFRLGTMTAALVIGVILAAMLVELVLGSLPAIKAFGWQFVVSSEWDAVQEKFGGLPFLYGSVVSSLLAIAIATPLSIGTALFITEIAPHRIGTVISTLVELLAAIPSVIYGLWGVLVLAPWLQQTVQPWLIDHLGFLPFFSGAPYGVSMLAAVLILAVMITPIITAITREVLLTVPVVQREAVLALGGTRWEVIRTAVLPYGKSGILGAVILGLGRAIGETMAVTMVIGNTPQISLSLLAPAYTLPSVIANEFAEASNALQGAALMEIGLILLATTLVINIFARLLIWSVARGPAGGTA